MTAGDTRAAAVDAVAERVEQAARLVPLSLADGVWRGAAHAAYARSLTTLHDDLVRLGQHLHECAARYRGGDYV